MRQEVIRINLDGVNCYLAKVKDGFILFDTGGCLFMDKEFTNRREILERELDKAGCKPGNLKLIILTHGDNDHVANASYIRNKYRTEIAMHLDDIELVNNPDIKKIMENCNYESITYRIIFILMKGLIKKVSSKILNNFERFKPDIYIDENYDLGMYGLKAKIISIPGHTLGSIGILFENGDFIAGDIFSNIKKPDVSSNAYNFKMLRNSIDKLKEMNIKNVYPGHGNPFEFKTFKN